MEVGWGGEGGMMGKICLLEFHLSHLTRYHRQQKEFCHDFFTLNPHNIITFPVKLWGAQAPTICHRNSYRNLYLKQALLYRFCYPTFLSEIRLGKNELHELRGVQFFKRFPAKYVKFSTKFGSLNVQIRNNFKISSS